MISLRDGVISRGDRELLRDVNLDVRRGTAHVIVGPNGSGKTTLLLALLGAGHLASGTLDYEGVAHQDHARPGRVRAFVGQAQDADPGLLVSEAVALYSGHRPLPPDVPLGVGTLWQKRLGALSAGQRVRVFLAAALLAHPAVLLLDEPTAFLDDASRMDLAGQLSSFLAGGGSVVLVSHDSEPLLPGAVTRQIVAGALLPG